MSDRYTTNQGRVEIQYTGIPYGALSAYQKFDKFLNDRKRENNLLLYRESFSCSFFVLPLLPLLCFYFYTARSAGQKGCVNRQQLSYNKFN